MAGIEEILKKEIVYKIDNMKNVDIQKNIVYKIEDSKELLMDLYTISNHKKQKLPVVVLIHGEAKSINFKETGQYTSYGKLIAASGLNAVTFNHKVLSDGFTVEEVNNDIEKIIKYLIENADKLNIDKNKIAIWCFSGGVPFGLYNGMSNSFDCVKAIIAYYGFCDLESVGRLLDFNIADEDILKYSPINLISEDSKRIPPLFIARAGLDNTIINESIDKFISKAIKNNLTIDVYNHADGGHAFDLFNEDDRTKEIIELSLKFLEYNLE